MMRNQNLLFFLALSLLMACSSDDNRLNYTMQNKDRQIGEGENMAQFKLSYPVFASTDAQEEQKLNDFSVSLLTAYNNAGSLDLVEQTFEKDYLEFIGEFPNSAANRWFLELNQKVISISDHWVALEYGEAQFMGGAHGMHYISYHTWDRQLQRELTLDDIVKDKEKFQKLLQREYIVQHDLDANTPLEEQGFFVENNHLPIAENFVVLSKGIFLRYNHYEIGPYSMGPSTVFISKDRLQGLLHDFEWPKKLLNDPQM